MEFFAVFMPKEPWKKLADILHLHPQKHQPQCPWFLSHCYGKEAPPNTLVAQCANMTAENVSELVCYIRIIILVGFYSNDVCICI